MRKLFTAFLCATIVLGLGGCGTKEQSNEEKGKILDEKLALDIKYNGISASDDDYYLISAKEIDGITLTGAAYIDEEEAKSTYTLRVTSGKFQYHTNKENGAVTEGIIISDHCTLNSKDMTNRQKEDACTEDDKKVAEAAQKKIDAFYKDLGLTEAEIYDYVAWYIQTNEAVLKDAYEAAALSDPAVQLEHLGYGKNSQGQYIKTVDETFGKIGNVDKYLFDFAKKNFAARVKNAETPIVVNWNNGNVSFNDASGQGCLYDTKKHTWIHRDCGQENELTAINAYTAFLEYTTKNNILFEVGK